MDPDSKIMTIRKSPVFVASDYYEKVKSSAAVPPDPFLVELFRPLKFGYKCVSLGFQGPVKDPKLRQLLDKQMVTLAAEAFIRRMQLNEASTFDDDDAMTEKSDEAAQTARTIAALRPRYTPL